MESLQTSLYIKDSESARIQKRKDGDTTKS